MADMPKIGLYKPFPTFAEWSRSGWSFNSFDGIATAFESAKASSGVTELTKAVDVATRWAAVDTGAIEGLYDVERGFTFTVALSAAAWDNIHQVKGESVASAIDDAMRAYEFVLDIATRSRPITEAWIRELHATICASQASYSVWTELGLQERELVKGAYKTDPNSPMNLASKEVHGYAPPFDTAPEMSRLVAELQSTEFASAHPIVQAAYAHYAFVCVHPFPDGNGRVSRALASVYLYRQPGVPLVIFADQKPSYLDTLEAADSGDFSPFVRFVGERVSDTMGMVRTVLDNASRPSIQDQIRAAQSMLIGRAGLGHQELDSIGIRFLEVFEAALNKVILESSFAPPLSSRVDRLPGVNTPRPSEFRSVPNNPLALRVTVSGSAPLNSIGQRTYSVGIARPDATVPDFVITSANGMEFFAELREMTPVVSAPLQFRAETLAQAEVGELLSEVVAEGQDALRNQGYAI